MTDRDKPERTWQEVVDAISNEKNNDRIAELASELRRKLNEERIRPGRKQWYAPEHMDDGQVVTVKSLDGQTEVIVIQANETELRVPRSMLHELDERK
jgi:hypothetical protein